MYYLIHKFVDYYILIAIFLIALFLRVYKISSVPPHLGNDEISIAYDSYSIWTTGYDSTGKFLPLSFKSHNTYKAPLYAYIAGPIIKLIGNNEFSVRFPSVLFGSLTVPVLYLFIQKITKNKNIAIFSSILLTFSPWHVYTSRIALESNLALFFLLLGSYLYYLGLKNSKYILLSVVSFVLSMYGYHTEWIITPIIMIFLTYINFNKFNNKKIPIFALIILGILVLPLLLDWMIVRNSTRAFSEFILRDYELLNRISGVGNIFTKLFIIFTFWFGKYLGYINIPYIFSNGLPVFADYQSATFGLLNIIQAPLFLLGTIYIIRSNFDKWMKLIIFWFFMTPFIPSMTLGEINLVRNLPSIIPWIVISAVGIYWLENHLGKIKISFLVLILVVINFAFFYRYYLIGFPTHFAENWQYGYKQIAEYIKENEEKYNQIIIDPHFGVINNKFIGVPSLYILYFNKINPKLFLTEKEDIDGGIKFLKYSIRDVNWIKEDARVGNLYIVSIHSKPISRNIYKIKSIFLPDGVEAFTIYEVRDISEI